MESKLFWLGWSKEGKKGSILFWSSSDVKSGHAVCFESSVCHEVKVRKLEARLTTLSLSRKALKTSLLNPISDCSNPESLVQHVGRSRVAPLPF